MSGSDVLCYGGVAIDTFVELPYTPKPGVAAISCTESYSIGGGAAHSAEWLASMGIPTRLSGNAIGRDERGDDLWGWLSAYPALDLSHLDRLDDVRTPYGQSIPFTDGFRYLLCFNFVGAPMMPASDALLEGIKILAINFYIINPEPIYLEIARLAHERGIQIVAADVVAVEQDGLDIADVVINSAASITEQFPGVDVRQRTREIQDASQSIVILTDSVDEVLAIDRDGSAFTVMPPEVEVSDATGAGDAFRAGLIYGILQDWPLTRSVRWATAVGALQVRRGVSQEAPPALDEISALAEGLEVGSLQ